MEDITLLRRVQALIADGLPPSRACALVLAESARATASPDGPELPEEHTAASGVPSTPALALRSRVRTACLALDEDAASDALGETFTLFGPELALEQVIFPALAEIGTAWAEGHASVATEHFASTLVRARLLAAFEGAAHRDRRTAVLLAAGPGDEHEIPVLALALLLRKRGWRAVFLGSNTPLEALRDAIHRTHPRLICLSATTSATVPGLVATLTGLRGMPEYAALILGYGGLPFREDPSLRRQLEGIAVYLGDDLREADKRAHLLLLGSPSPDGDPG
jgi:methanogenic corrinoid protein MtbC1